MKINVNEVNEKWKTFSDKDEKVEFSEVALMVKSVNFCSPPMTEYFFEDFIIQTSYDYLSKKFQIRKVI